MIAILLVLAVASPAVLYAASPVARSGMNGAATSYWSGYRSTVLADRAKRRAVRATARENRIKFWQSKRSGWQGTAKWRAWQVASWTGTLARTHARAVRTGLAQTRTGWSEGVKRGRMIKEGRRPSDIESDQPLGPEAPTANQWHAIKNPVSGEAATEGEKMQQAEFTTAQEIHTATLDMGERFAAVVEELQNFLTAIGEGTVKSKSILEGVGGAQEGLMALEGVHMGLNAILEGAKNLMNIGETMAAEEIEADVTVGALVGS